MPQIPHIFAHIMRSLLELIILLYSLKVTRLLNYMADEIEKILFPEFSIIVPLHLLKLNYRNQTFVHLSFSPPSPLINFSALSIFTIVSSILVSKFCKKKIKLFIFMSKTLT